MERSGNAFVGTHESIDDDVFKSSDDGNDVRSAGWTNWALVAVAKMVIKKHGRSAEALNAAFAKLCGRLSANDKQVDSLAELMSGMNI